jgi:phospholipid transport system substrate-binding protein
MLRRALPLILAVTLPLVAAAGPDPEAAARSRGLVAAFTRVPEAPGPVRSKAFAELDGYLALEELVSAAVAPRASRFTAAELTRFKQSFREVLRLVAYTESGAFFRKAALTWAEPRVEGSATAVQARVVVAAEDLRTDLEFRWQRIGGALKVVDVVFEGDSLLKDYQNQFARIIDKSGPAGLQRAVDERRAELTREKRK